MTHLSTIDQQGKQVANIHQMLVWTLRIIAALMALCLVFDFIYQSTLLRTFGVLAAGFCFTTICKIWLLKRGWYYTFVVLLNLELGAFGLGIATVAFIALPIVVLYPVIITLCSSVFVSDKQLKSITLSALIISMVTLAVSLFTTTEIVYPWYSKLMSMLAVLATQLLVLLLAWHSRQHQATLLEQSRAANSALQDMHAHLEHTVSERTSELAQTVSLLRTTLDATTDGILVADTAGNMLVWNRKLADMWHIPGGHLIEHENERRLLYVHEQLRNPKAFLQQTQSIYKDPEAESYDTLHFKDGRVFDRYSQPQAVDGKIVGRVWSFRDVTERVQAEQRSLTFAALGQELSATVTVEDAARTIIAVADDLFGWDACYLDFYYPEEETLQTIVCFDTIGGQRVETPLPPPSKLSFAEHRIIRQGPQLVLREPAQSDPDEFVPFGDTSRPSASLMFAPICRGSSTIGVLSIQSYTYNAYAETDLATFQSLANHCAGALDRNRSEAALRRAEEERQQLERKMLETQKRESLGVLAGGIAHDFNNLLTVMQGNMGLARLDLEAGHPALESLQQAEVATRRAADLTHQMLAYAGKGQLATQHVALNELLGEMRGMLHASLPKRIHFDYQFDQHLPWIEADATQVRQMIMNLLVNAAEAVGDAQGEVVVRTNLIDVAQADLANAVVGGDARAGRYVSLEVEDTGSGMDSATLSRIFEPFFTTKFTGRGLGLAAVLGIVRSHGGAIRVRSDLGRGTLFQVLLPPAAPPAAPLSTEAQHVEWRGNGAALIIDDEPMIRSLVSRMIEQLGMTPHVAEDGDAGVAAFRKLAGTVAIVVLDLTMPGRSVQQVLDDLHAIDPHAPVLLMSGYSEQDAQRLLDHPQVVAFLHKPFHLAELRSALQQALEIGVGER